MDWGVREGTGEWGQMLATAEETHGRHNSTKPPDFQGPDNFLFIYVLGEGSANALERERKEGGKMGMKRSSELLLLFGFQA